MRCCALSLLCALVWCAPRRAHATAHQHDQPLVARASVGGGAWPLPLVLDSLLADAFHQLDVASHGVLGDWTGPDVSFSSTDNDSTLVARVLLPPPPRRLKLTVLAHSHLQLDISAQQGALHTRAVHTVALPAQVHEQPLRVEPQRDGSVHVLLQKRVEQHTRTERAADTLTESIHEQELPLVPDALTLQRCSRSSEHALQFRACVCDGYDDDVASGRCVDSVLSSCRSALRRFGQHTHASHVKHAALQCTQQPHTATEAATARAQLTHCVTRVMQQCIERVRELSDARDVTQRRERDDDGWRVAEEHEGGGTFRRYSVWWGAVVVAVGVMALGGGVLMGVALSARYLRVSNVAQRLSGALAQRRGGDGGGGNGSGSGGGGARARGHGVSATRAKRYTRVAA
eukprot:TRINITY_DN469_c1_g1_i1.p1 TRINITY_DN469_c1_g1~~TRINITY_DN469_c1_g1_i1.p1  ORF type:complete len:402 (+),score=101.17 TRINITY_DN469_c1_g1_i1:1717-2922(+)